MTVCFQTRTLSPRRRAYDRGAAHPAVCLPPASPCALLVFLIGYIFYRGLPNISWELLTSQTSVHQRHHRASCPTFLNTLYIILLAHWSSSCPWAWARPST